MGRSFKLLLAALSACAAASCVTSVPIVPGSWEDMVPGERYRLSGYVVLGLNYMVIDNPSDLSEVPCLAIGVRRAFDAGSAPGEFDGAVVGRLLSRHFDGNATLPPSKDPVVEVHAYQDGRYWVSAACPQNRDNFLALETFEIGRQVLAD